MNLKPKFEEYTEAEFTALIEEIYGADGGEAYQDVLIKHVCEVSEHPEGSDLIFYNDNDNITPAGIVAEIKTWRAANSKPSFKA